MSGTAHEKPTRRPLIAAAFVLAAAIFLVDFRLPLGASVPTFYVVVVLLGLWSPARGFTAIAAVLASLLTMLAAVLSPIEERMANFKNKLDKFSAIKGNVVAPVTTNIQTVSSTQANTTKAYDFAQAAKNLFSYAQNTATIAPVFISQKPGQQNKQQPLQPPACENHVARQIDENLIGLKGNMQLDNSDHWSSFPEMRPAEDVAAENQKAAEERRDKYGQKFQVDNFQQHEPSVQIIEDDTSVTTENTPTVPVVGVLAPGCRGARTRSGLT